MIITLSPAKILNFKSTPRYSSGSDAKFSRESEELIGLLKHLSQDEIGRLMDINAKQTMEVFHQIQSFDVPDTPQKQAIFSYNGIAYKGFDANTLDAEHWAFAQKHLVILSGLYGVLRPLDRIKPYRLEQQAALVNEKGKDLYAYWSEKVSKHMAEMMVEDDRVWINLSSKEYTKVINKKLLPKDHRIITPIFKEFDGVDSYRQVIVYAKKARGMMARFIVENEITDTEYIKAFDAEGYYFSPQLSKGNEWVFIR